EVKDTSGAVLPGVTVEAASPALIEKVRTAVADGSGRYRIESLPPGSYTVTFSLIGFAQVRREDITVSGSGVITVDVDLPIDGVQMANPSQFNQELFDIDSIQVLKGPQGALYGRNAIGGAILINTKKPSDVFEGSVMVGSDSGPGIKVRGSMSGPITSTLKY